MKDQEKREIILRSFPKIEKRHLNRMIQKVHEVHEQTVNGFVAAYIRHAVTNYDARLAQVKAQYYGGMRAQARFDVESQVNAVLLQWRG